MKFIELQSKLKNKGKLLWRLHTAILSVHPKIKYRIFPIYIVYNLKDRNIALIYYKGKMVKESGLCIGLSLSKVPKNKRFVRASGIKYPGITYGANFQNTSQVTPATIETIRSISTT